MTPLSETHPIHYQSSERESKSPKGKGGGDKFKEKKTKNLSQSTDKLCILPPWDVSPLFIGSVIFTCWSSHNYLIQFP